MESTSVALTPSRRRLPSALDVYRREKQQYLEEHPSFALQEKQRLEAEEKDLRERYYDHLTDLIVDAMMHRTGVKFDGTHIRRLLVEDRGKEFERDARAYRLDKIEEHISNFGVQPSVEGNSSQKLAKVSRGSSLFSTSGMFRP